MTQKATSEIDKEIGRRMKARREIIGLSQEKLGAALGLTFQQVQKYEKGTNRISAARLLQLADLLGVRVSFFFGSGKEGDSGPGNAPQDLIVDRDAAILLRAFNAVRDQEMRRAIISVASAAASRSGS